MDRDAEISRLLAGLESALADLDRLKRDITRQAEALARAACRAEPARSVYSLHDAAAELGVSVSMLHKLLRQGRFGHLKVGARTLITADQLTAFRAGAQVDTRPDTRSNLPGVAS